MTQPEAIPQPANIVRSGRPSLSALRVARLRAAHQLLDQPKVLDDPLALAILGADGEAEIRKDLVWLDHPLSRQMRASLAIRSRVAEDELHAAVQRGVQQYVVLGAGLDTFAYRNVHQRETLKVFEVDHPSTQQWKRTLLADASIRIPESTVYVPVDFEHEELADGLAQAAFRFDQPAFFSWLGVTVYLTRDAIFDTLRFVASLPPGSGIAFDYGLDPSLLDPLDRAARDFNCRTSAGEGEPWISFFRPDELVAQLRQIGFSRVDNWATHALFMRFLSGRADRLRAAGTYQVICAQV